MNEIFPRPAVPLDPMTSAAAGRPVDSAWLAINMVMSVDGAISVDGRSGGLGGPADRAMFLGLRAASDVVLVGAETVRSERYHRTVEGAPTIAVVSGSAHFPDGLPLFDIGTVSVRVAAVTDGSRFTRSRSF